MSESEQLRTLRKIQKIREDQNIQFVDPVSKRPYPQQLQKVIQAQQESLFCRYHGCQLCEDLEGRNPVITKIKKKRRSKTIHIKLRRFLIAGLGETIKLTTAS